MVNPDCPDVCTWGDLSHCSNCALEGELNCRFEGRRLEGFFAMVIPFIASSMVGLYLVSKFTGKWWLLAAYLGFYLAFFVFLEALVLCRHCPHYAGGGSFIRCHANYGLPRIWAYDPRPLNTVERVSVLAGFGFFGLYPIAVEVYGLWMGWSSPLSPSGNLLKGITVLNIVTAIMLYVLLKRFYCTRCVNFGCPLNSTSTALMKAYLEKNPSMKRSWEEAGWATPRRG